MKSYILVVEDNAIESLKVAKMLEVAGFIPVVATDGLAALDICEQYKINAALIDIQLPHMNGFTLLERLKKMSEEKKFPILMMTASHHEARHVKEAISLGAKDFIIKPIDAQMLQTKVRGLLEDQIDWSERSLAGSNWPTTASVSHSIEVTSISEMGLRIHSTAPIENNSFLELKWPVLQQEGVDSVKLKVIDCEPAEKGYSIYLTFLGVPEHQLKKIRVLCMRLGVSNKKELIKES